LDVVIIATKRWYKIFRRKNKILLNNTDSDEIVFVEIKETSNPCLMAKDGKIVYFSDKERRE